MVMDLVTGFLCVFMWIVVFSILCLLFFRLQVFGLEIRPLLCCVVFIALGFINKSKIPGLIVIRTTYADLDDR